MKKKPIIEPPVDDMLLPVFRDPPLTEHGDAPLDERGHLVERNLAKSFNECLEEIEEEEDWEE